MSSITPVLCRSNLSSNFMKRRRLFTNRFALRVLRVIHYCSLPSILIGLVTLCGVSFTQLNSIYSLVTRGSRKVPCIENEACYHRKMKRQETASIIRAHEQWSHNDYNSWQDVPPHLSRFDFPWYVPHRLQLPTLNSSNNRIFLSTIRERSGSGLGHRMATLNLEVTIAIKFKLTYTHRVSSYGYLSNPLNSSQINSLTRPFHHAGAVEQFFGWGVNEIPREAVQNIICPTQRYVADNNCPICDFERTVSKDKLARHSSKETLKVDRVIDIPVDLCSTNHLNPSKLRDSKLSTFLSKNNIPNSVFRFPTILCDRNAALRIESHHQKSFFFHKYWDTHGFREGQSFGPSKWENETFRSYKSRTTTGMRIQPVGGRPTLSRMYENELNVAVHARRGDFFVVGRPMISMTVISTLIKAIDDMIIASEDSIFSGMKLTVSIYSQGQRINSTKVVHDHDISKMEKVFRDVDEQPLTKEDVLRIILQTSENNFRNGVDVKLRTSDDTLLCLHEMISADIFVGSQSGLSENIVATLSRAAFLLLPNSSVIQSERHVKFHPQTGNIEKDDVLKMKSLWTLFASKNRASALNWKQRTLTK